MPAAILSKLTQVVGSMLMNYLMNSETIEKLVLFGLQKLVDSTDSKVDNEILKLVTARTQTGTDKK